MGELAVGSWEQESCPCPSPKQHSRDGPGYKLRYLSGPDPGLWIGPTHWWIAGVHEGACPTYPKLQDLYDTGQQKNNQEESQYDSSIDGLAEARGLIPD